MFALIYFYLLYFINSPLFIYTLLHNLFSFTLIYIIYFTLFSFILLISFIREFTCEPACIATTKFTDFYQIIYRNPEPTGRKSVWCEMLIFGLLFVENTRKQTQVQSIQNSLNQ